MTNSVLIQLIQSHASDALVRRVIDSDIDIDETNESGVTALVEAIKYTRLDAVYLLINKGANIHIRDTTCYRDSALSWAVYLGKTHIVRMLLNLGADVNLQTKYHGNTVLLWACQRQFYEIFVLLMRKGADPTICSYSGKTVNELCDTTPFRTVLDEWRLEMSIAVHGFVDRWMGNRSFERGVSKIILSFLI